MSFIHHRHPGECVWLISPASCKAASLLLLIGYWDVGEAACLWCNEATQVEPAVTSVGHRLDFNNSDSDSDYAYRFRFWNF